MQTSPESTASYNFTFRSIVKEAWQRTRGLKFPVWGSVVIYFLASMLILSLGHVVLSFLLYGEWDSGIMKFEPETEAYKTVIEWIRWLLLFPMHTGILLLAVRKALDLPVQLRQVFSVYRCYLPLLVIGFLLFLIISLSKSLLLFGYDMAPNFETVLGILDLFVMVFFSLWVMFASLLVVEKKSAVFFALKLSFKQFMQHWFKIMLIIVCLILPYFIIVNIVFFMFFGTALAGSTSIGFWLAWGMMVGMIILSTFWVIPFFTSIGGVLYRIMFGEK